MDAVYRVHDQPSPDDVAGLRDYLATLDYSLVKSDAVRPVHFNQILKIAEERDEKDLVSTVVLRAQRQAIYDKENRGHFGLNLPRYAHFTSPIRRYADLIVHRALVRACNLGAGGITDKEIAELENNAQQISDLERRAIAAERDTTDRYLSDYLSTRIGVEFDARIRGVTKYGLFITLDESGADGFIPMRTIGHERFRLDEENHALVGERSNAIYHLGQPVRAVLAEAIPLTGSLRFELLTDPIPAPSRKKTTTKKTNAGPRQKKEAPRNKSKSRNAPTKKRDQEGCKKTREKAAKEKIPLQRQIAAGLMTATRPIPLH